MTSTAIEVRGVQKAYAGVSVLRGVDLEVDAGAVPALLGADGAGRSR